MGHFNRMSLPCLKLEQRPQEDLRFTAGKVKRPRSERKRSELGQNTHKNTREGLISYRDRSNGVTAKEKKSTARDLWSCTGGGPACILVNMILSETKGERASKARAATPTGKGGALLLVPGCGGLLPRK